MVLIVAMTVPFQQADSITAVVHIAHMLTNDHFIES